MVEISKRYLVLCSEGQKRSPIGANVLRRMLYERGREQDYVTDGAYSFFAQCPEKRVKHVNSFDEIIVMDLYMLEGLIRAGISEEKIFCFNIRDDDYISKNDPLLIGEFERKFTEYFKNKGGIRNL